MTSQRKRQSTQTKTGIKFGVHLKNQKWFPDGIARGLALESDVKSRFTLLLWGNDDGEVSPSFLSSAV